MRLMQQPLTLEQFLTLPERKPPLEFEDGTVSRKVAPKPRHSWLQYALVAWVNRAGVPQRVALALPELRATFAGFSRVPDVVVYRWERVPWDAAGNLPDDVSVAPDIAIEIISPKQSVNRLLRRCLWYVA